MFSSSKLEFVDIVLYVLLLNRFLVIITNLRVFNKELSYFVGHTVLFINAKMRIDNCAFGYIIVSIN